MDPDNKAAEPIMPTPGTGTLPVGTPASAKPGQSDRNFLAAFLLTMSFGFTGLHQLYLGNKKQAWIRFVLLITVIFSFVSYIWALVDFFVVYLGKKDAEGKLLAGTDRDRKAAAIIFWGYIIFISLYIIGMLLFFTFAWGSIQDYNNAGADYKLQEYSL